MTHVEKNRRAMEDNKHPTVLDTDALIDELLAKKGPQSYSEGLSENNWEEVTAVQRYIRHSKPLFYLRRKSNRFRYL